MKSQLSIEFPSSDRSFSLPGSGTERLLYSFGKVMLGATSTSADGNDFTPGSSHPEVTAEWRDPSAATTVVRPGAEFVVRYGGVVGRGVVSSAGGDGLAIAPGVELRHGSVPVSIRWIVDEGVLETTATDGRLVYVVGQAVTAIRASDGTVAWRFDPAASDDAELASSDLHASGGVVVGLASDDVLRVFAPWEYDLELDRTSGRLVSITWTEAGTPGGRFVELAAAPARSLDIEHGLEGATATVQATGEIAFEVVVHHPMYDESEPIEVADTIVLGLSSGHVVALDVSAGSQTR